VAQGCTQGAGRRAWKIQPVIKIAKPRMIAVELFGISALRVNAKPSIAIWKRKSVKKVLPTEVAVKKSSCTAAPNAMVTHVMTSA
jgi:hypothetical protein